MKTITRQISFVIAYFLLFDAPCIASRSSKAKYTKELYMPSRAATSLVEEDFTLTQGVCQFMFGY